VSGILMISAQAGLMTDIVKMAKELDEQAAPKTTVRVHRVNGNVSAESLQKAIDKAVGTAWLGGKPEQPPAQAKEGDRGQGDRNRGDRGEGGNNGGNNNGGGNNGND
jgi:hypothetical protein